ncbi:hypothetical protein Tco_0458179 [Tanacetum coccineum]
MPPSPSSSPSSHQHLHHDATTVTSRLSLHSRTKHHNHTPSPPPHLHPRHHHHHPAATTTISSSPHTTTTTVHHHLHHQHPHLVTSVTIDEAMKAVWDNRNTEKGVVGLAAAKRRLAAELEGLGEQGNAVRDFENIKEIVARDSVMLSLLEQLLARAQVGGGS